MHNFNISFNTSEMVKYNINISKDLTELKKFGKLIDIPELMIGDLAASSIPPMRITVQFLCEMYDDKVAELMDIIAMKANTSWHEGCIHKLMHDAYVTNGDLVFEVLKCERCGEAFSKNLREL